MPNARHILFVLLLSGLHTGFAQNHESQKAVKHPHPPGNPPPYSLDQPPPETPPAVRRPQPVSPQHTHEKPAEPTGPETKSPQQAEPQPSAGRSRMPGYLVLIGLVMLFLRKVPAKKE